MSPTEPPHKPAAIVVRLADLLPETRRAVEAARTPSGWDRSLLKSVLANEFDFLGPYIAAEIRPFSALDEKFAAVMLADGEPDEEWLLLQFSPPTDDRDLVATERRFEQAARASERGDVARALPTLERVAREAPEVAKYHRALGQAHLVQGRLEDAEDALLRSLRLNPRDPDGLTLLGNLYAHRGLHEAAVPLYERSLALGRNVYALNNLAAALARLGRSTDAVRLFREAIAEDASYPNARYGLALALTQSKDSSVLREAIASLEAALSRLGERKHDTAVWDASRGLLDQLSELEANEETGAAASAVRAVLVDRETAIRSTVSPAASLPVRIEQSRLAGGILAKIEMGWVHDRGFHRLLIGEGAGLEREHYVLHELEHLTLTEAARTTGTNRWFASTAETHARAMRSLESSLGRARRKGLGETEARQMIESTISGLLGQLFNFPIDLLIETRLLERYPNLRELFYQSVWRQLDTAARIAEDTNIKAITPTKVFRANTAMNVAMALWLEARFPRVSDLVARFRKSEAFDLGQRLYRQWSEAVGRWTPGAEYGWVDAWAEMLGLRDWYVWQDDAKPSMPPDDADSSAGPSGDLAPAQEAGATFYMLAALEWMDGRSLREVTDVARGAAMIGRGGVQYRDPDSRYKLPGYREEAISGLQLLSTMYVLIKVVAPDADQGINLERQYDAARTLFVGKHGHKAAPEGAPPDCAS